MKLNPDCIRDILLVVEESSDFNTPTDSSNFKKLESKYSPSEILYHIRQVDMSGLTVDTRFFMGGGFMIKDLSPSGHKFLSDIRNDDNWNKTKSIAHKVGSFSLDALSSIASGVTTAAINKFLNQ